MFIEFRDVPTDGISTSMYLEFTEENHKTKSEKKIK